MAITASFLANAGVLSIFSDSLDNTVTVSRNAAGTILINGGAVPVQGGLPTVANTALIQAFGLAGNDNLRLDLSNGALPAANLFGGIGNDTITGGTGGDFLFGQSDNDILIGGGGFDALFGGDGNDTLTGGDADDQVFGEGGDDLMVWNPGDDTDLFEGGAGTDTAQVNGGGGAEVFSLTANGTRVRFDRLDPAPFALDLGATENIVLNANGGDDFFSATGNLAALIKVTVDGGAGDDTLLGSNGADTLLGGAGDDFIDGQQGNDLAFLGAGDDTFQWDPGDGNDVVEGQDGTDTMLFNGSGGDEIFEASANGGRVLFTRSLGNIVMDLNDVETIQLNALGGADTVTVNDLSGTDVVEVNIDLAGTVGGTAGDGQADVVIANGTNGNDLVQVVGAGTNLSVFGLAAQVNVSNSEGANDSLVINALGGDDKITATTLPAGVAKLTIDGGAGDDTILGSQGADVFLGGDGDDSVFGDNGNDTAFLGAGDDVFQWDPGDGNDVVEGQDGVDTMLFNGSGVNENVSIFANGGRAIFFRDVASVVMDLNDVETIDFNALGGADNIVVGDLSGTDVTKVDIDLAGIPGGAAGDKQVDSVTVNGTQGDDVITIASVGGKIVVDGLQAQVVIDHAEAGDKLVINGLGGDDVIDASSLDAGKIQLQVNGGLGADVIIGSEGNDTVNGGDGDDTAFLDAGDDVFVWNPGDDNDVVEGQAGTDTMLFNGANVAENIDIFANGGRTIFFRNVASVVMDLNDVETIQFNALGGADNINVGDLSGTDLKLVSIDLAGTIGGTAGDAQPDTVSVNATNGNDGINLTQVGSKIAVDGLSAKVTIDHAEAADKLVVNAQGGNDTINALTLAAAAIQLVLDGGAGNDTITGGAGADQILGQSGDDVLLGGTGTDTLFGGDGNDTLTGGDGDDQAFGEAGDDRMIWNPGDDTDLFEGGDGIDTAEVNGGSGAEIFTVTANGARVRFDRLDPAPFSIDIGTTEELVLNANGGDDFVSATGNLAALIQLTVDGGAGNDTILGSNGADTLLGGAGDDFIDGQQGNDVAFLGAGDDTFQWDPGDGSDVVEGQDGTDTMLFNGSGGSEVFEASANGGRVLFTRNLGNIVMDLDDVETIQLNALGGADTITVNDLSGTDVTEVNIDLAGVLGGTAGDGQSDTVIVNGSNADNAINVTGSGTSLSVTGLPATVSIKNSEGANDTLVVNGLGGDDKITATTLPAGVAKLVLDGGAGDDTLLGSQGADTFLGGDGNDSVFGDNGDDVALLGAGDDVFQWDPGDGNDVVEGQDGVDTMLFNGANVAENVDIVANGGRALFLRNVANVTMDLNDVETIDFNALGGADNIVVGDLSGTDVTKVDIDLAGVVGGTKGDRQVDSVTVNGTNGDDVITIASVGSQIVVKGLSSEVVIDHAEAGDKLVINGLGGDDVIDASKLDAGKIQLQVNAGLGDDVIIGSAGDDTINGGDGDDFALLGAGNDVFVWNPGDDNDVIEGQAGTDTMLFNGANVAENIDISANGGRALFFRNVASVTMDLNDVETIQFNALGGADNINVGDLSGTDVELVSIDLAGTIGGTAGDGQLDTVAVSATNGDDLVSISSRGSKVLVDGLSAQVAVDHAEATDRLVVNGLAGDDVFDASGLQAGKTALQLFAGAGDDVIIGSSGDDLVDGGTGDDVLLGGAGNDTISGGAGDDLIFGDSGNDSYVVSSPLDGHDVIAGFDGDAAGGQDTLDLDALFDGLGVAAADRTGRVSVADNGASVNVSVDADGNAANGFEFVVATLNTSDAVSVGSDVIVGT